MTPYAVFIPASLLCCMLMSMAFDLSRPWVIGFLCAALLSSVYICIRLVSASGN